jgi:thioredoxin 1
MPMTKDYAASEPPRDEVNALPGPTLVEFGSPWCGHCRVAQQPLAEAFAGHPDVRHIKVEDGSGYPLGRSFRVKLWPTLIFMKDGVEVSRLVRPRSVDPITEALDQIDP